MSQNKSLLMIMKCPNCQDFVEIGKLNCGIFCHGVMKKTGKQISPHITEQKSAEYAKKGLIFGCGKHFIINKQSNAKQSNAIKLLNA